MSYDDRFDILNFYVVKNKATKSDETKDFARYKSLRDNSKKAFYLERGCQRKWMNQSDETCHPAGINIHWPILTSETF